MSWEAWFTLGILVLVVTALVRNKPADLVLLAALLAFQSAALVSSQFPGAKRLWSGFANEALLTVAVLYVVVSGLTQTAAISTLTGPLFASARTLGSVQWRLMSCCAGLSAFLNNTPIVAMFLPAVSQLCRQRGFAPSKLFLPLSYATILGGLCTLIGTSTNMIVYGLVQADADPRTQLSLFDPAWVGLPCALVGIAFLALGSRWLLPERKPSITAQADPREYSTELEVLPDSPLVERSIEEAGLRGLPGAYLAQIERDGQRLHTVSKHERLRAGDRLCFVGALDSVRDLTRIRGLAPPDGQAAKLSTPRLERCWVEAVVAPNCPLVGQSIREGRFRTVYDAAVIAVGRSGARLPGKIGDIVLEAGDQLLLEADPAWHQKMRDSRDFYLVSKLEDSTPAEHDRGKLAIAILVLMVVAAGMEWLSMLHAGLAAAALMLALGCTSVAAARRAIDWEVLITIGAALGVGEVISSTGLAQNLAQVVLQGLSNPSPYVALIAIYAVTMLLTELLSNNAAAALMFPIATATAASLGVHPMPFVMVLLVAASCGFATPLGYQTNLMVYGPGGYRFTDFLRAGGALNLVVMAVALLIIPWVWPLGS